MNRSKMILRNVRLCLAMLLASRFIELSSAACLESWCNDHGHCVGIGDDAYCWCDYGFTSSDYSECDIKVCPRGDDPLTTNQDYRVISMAISSDHGTIKGSLQFSFFGEHFSFDANTNVISTDSLAEKIKKLPNVADASVSTGEAQSSGGSIYNITFLRWPTYPLENNVHYHSGNPSLASFECNAVDLETQSWTKSSNDVTCAINDVVNSNLREYATCSKHGSCNKNLGLCKCDPGWSGVACQDNRDVVDVQEFSSAGPFFAGNLVKLKAVRDFSNEFNFIEAVSGQNEDNMISVRGDGSIIMYHGDIRMKSGSINISGGESASMNASDTGCPAITASSNGGGGIFHGDGSNFSASVVELRVDRSPSKNFFFLKAKASMTQESLFEIDGEGLFRTKGGFEVVPPSGNQTMIMANLPKISAPRAEIGEGGIMIHRGSLNITGQGSVVIGTGGGIEVKNGLTKLSSFQNSTTLNLRRYFIEPLNRKESLPGTVIIEHFGEPNGVHMPHFEAKTDGKVVFKIGFEGKTEIDGGLKVKNGGLKIISGGIYVGFGGLEVSGGLKVNSGTLELNDPDNGLRVSGGGIESTTKSISAAAFRGDATNENFKGAILELNGPKQPGKMSAYRFIDMISNGKKSVFSVTSDGSVYAEGGIYANANIDTNKLRINGGTIIKRTSIKAADIIILRDISKCSFVEIINDGKFSMNQMKFEEAAIEGQLLMVKNSDSEPLLGMGLSSIPPSSLLLFLWIDPQGWVDLTTSAAHQRVLERVTRLTAENDLNLGEHTLASGSFVVNSKSSPKYNGQLVFFGPGGALVGEENVKYNHVKKVMEFQKISAEEFVGASINFHGSTISNAALTNITLEKLEHLTVGSLGVLSLETGSIGGGSKLATVDKRGQLGTANHIRWFEDSNEMKVSAISSFSSTGLEFRSDVDMQYHKLRNVDIEKGTKLENLNIVGGFITNSVLRNVTAENLKLGAVTVEGIKISGLSKSGSSGRLLSAGEKGEIVINDLIQEVEGVVIFGSDVAFMGDIDIKNNEVSNVQMISGRIKGDSIGIEVDLVEANSIVLRSIQRDKAVVDDTLLAINKSGKLIKSPFTLTEDGSLKNVHIVGNLDFGMKHSVDKGDEIQGGMIINAHIKGGSADGLDELHVKGDAHIEGDMIIGGDTFIESGLTVSGSVLGSGPYIDVSDARLKKNIKPISGSDVLGKVVKLAGVTYELDLSLKNNSVSGYQSTSKSSAHSKSGVGNIQSGGGFQQIGFLAQEVEKVFPELVYTGKDGYKGLHYSRFVPLLVEGIKDLSYTMSLIMNEMKELRVDQETLRDENNMLMKIIEQMSFESPEINAEET